MPDAAQTDAATFPPGIPLRYLAPIVLGLLFAALTCFAILDGRRASVDATETLIVRRASAFGRMMAANLAIRTAPDRREEVDSFFREMANMPQLRLGLLLDYSNRVVHATAKDPAVDAYAEELAAAVRAIAGATNRFSSDRKLLRAAFPVLVAGAPRPWIFYTESDIGELLAQDMAKRIRRVAVLGGFALCVCLVAGWYFNRYVTRPATALAGVMARLSDGDLRARAPSGGVAEMARLAESANAMAAQLESRDRALREMKEELEESERCLALALQFGNRGLCQMDLSTGQVRVSPWLVQFLGLDSPTLAGDAWMSRVHADDVAGLAAVWDAHRGGAESHTFEYRMRSGAGDWEWVLSEGKLLGVSVPGRVMVAGSLKVISETRRAQRLVAEQTRLLEHIAAGGEIGELLVAILRSAEADSDGMLCSVMLPDASRGRLFPAAAPSLAPSFLRAIEGLPIEEGAGVCGTAARRGERVVVGDVEADPLCAGFLDLARIHSIRACWSEPFFGMDGRLLGTFAMYYREPRMPTARHEEAIRMATHLASIAVQRAETDARLRESEARFRYLADAAPVMTWMCDALGQTTYLSRSWRELTGTDDSDLGEGWMHRIHPEDLLSAQSVFQHALTARRRFEVSFRVRRGDGEYRWLYETGVPRFGAEGRFEGFIGCCLDVTERRALEEQVRQSQKMESVGRLAAGVAHDFNNILTVILGNASLLPAVNGDIGRAAAEITAAAQRAARLTRQLLVFSRQQPFRTRALEIHELIRGFMGMAARLVGEDVRIVFHPAGHRSFVQADPVLLEQVLLNLAVNARDAMPRGGTLTILTRRCDAAGQPELSFGDFPSHVLVSVSDTGPGIPASILPRIFEPFFTTKEVGKGTGLGLATAYGIVEQHGGRISAWNAHAGGACFEILLPLTTDPERAEPVDRMSAGTVGGAERLLVVEDDPGLLRLATTFLERHGYSVTPASSGVDALRVWQERAGAFDLLLTDIVMPGGIDGLRLARLLRAGRAELKVIYMSGYSPEFATAEASGLTPGVDFLQKPYDMDALVRMVRERLDAEAVPV